MLEINKREHYLDVLKGIGILFVVFGHITHVWGLRGYIWGFHMPLFFLVSGMLFDRIKYQSFSVFLKKRINGLVLPYFFLAFVNLGLWCVTKNHMKEVDDSTWVDQLLGIFYGNMNGAVGALWFLPALFSMECIFYVISFLGNRWVVLLVTVIANVIGFVLLKTPLEYLPWGINLALIAMPFYGIGNVFAHEINSIKKKSFLLKILAVLVCAILSYLLLPITHYDLSMHSFANYYGYIPVGLCGIFTYLFLSQIINSNKVLEWLGRNTLVLIAFHGTTYRVFLFLVSKIANVPVEVMRTNFFICLLVAVAVIFILYPVIVLYNKYIQSGLKFLK